MMRAELRAFFGEPAPERPASPSSWDRGLALVLVPVTLAEAMLREGLGLRGVYAASGVIFAGAMAFRRTRPLAAVATAFGVAALVGVLEIVVGLPSVTLATSLCVLLLPYSLTRWASGREMALGFVFVLMAYAVGVLQGEMHDASEAIGAATVLLFPAVLGASVRFRADAHRRDVEHAKLRERAQLARDLHDTVAHHVSAIAIQAQAGRAILATRPGAMAGILDAIEKEAARTLSELRSMVGALRDDGGGQLAPQPGVRDIERFARNMGSAPVVDVGLDDAVDDLRPSLQSALYRIAQESITNAIRHATGATRVEVRVAAQHHLVRLTVEDDGRGVRDRGGSGFGLVGMAERAALLGGTLEAGPREGGGWAVEVILPRQGEGR